MNDFHASLEPILQAFSGSIGVKAVRLSDGHTLEHNAQEVFPAASVMKVWLMLEAFTQVEAGSLELHQRIPLPADERVGGSGVLMRVEGGAGLTLLDYINLMIVVSDNTATNVVMDAVGGRDAVNARLRGWGLERTRVVGKLMLPFEKKNEDQKAGKLAEITPQECVTVLERLHRGELLNADLTALALEIMGAQQYTEIIARYLPDDVKVATKSGQITGVRNDIGFVWAKEPYIVALCSQDCADARFHIDNEAVLALGRVSKLVFDAMQS
jgi:beta-lactamase class A